MKSLPPALTILRAGTFHPWLGVFETICVRGGRPIFLEEHWQSLRRGCAALGMKRPFDFRPLAHQLPSSDGRWRWLIGADGPRHFFQPEQRRRLAGLSLILSSVRVGSANWDARYKTLSYLSHWQARSEHPAGESLLLNEHDRIAGGAMSNIFWVRKGRLHTPDETSGCRAGVVRGWVLAQGGVLLSHSQPSVLDDAEEIFLSNSMLGICPVNRWRDRALKSGPMTRLLQQRYARFLRSI